MYCKAKRLPFSLPTISPKFSKWDKWKVWANLSVCLSLLLFTAPVHSEEVVRPNEGGHSSAEEKKEVRQSGQGESPY